MKYRTYKTCGGAQRYADKLNAQFPKMHFYVDTAPDQSFRYAVCAMKGTQELGYVS